MKLPEPRQGGGTNPYLKVSDIPNGSKATKVSVLGNVRESNSKFGEGIELDAIVGGRTFTWTVRFASGNYLRLVQRFGKDSDQWKGTVTVARGTHLGKEYVKILD